MDGRRRGTNGAAAERDETLREGPAARADADGAEQGNGSGRSVQRRCLRHRDHTPRAQHPGSARPARHHALGGAALAVAGVRGVPDELRHHRDHVDEPSPAVLADPARGPHAAPAERPAAWEHRLLDDRADPRAIRAITRGYAFGPLLYFVSCALALVSVPASLALNVALALFFALPPRLD